MVAVGLNRPRCATNIEHYSYTFYMGISIVCDTAATTIVHIRKFYKMHKIALDSHSLLNSLSTILGQFSGFKKLKNFRKLACSLKLTNKISECKLTN